MEEPTASELLAQAHEEQELKEAANRRGDSKAALAHAKARRRALDAACHTAAGREAQRLLRSGGAKAPDFVVKLYCMFTEYPSLIYWTTAASSCRGRRSVWNRSWPSSSGRASSRRSSGS